MTTTVSEITVYVPAPGEHSAATADIAKGSAIVGQPSPDGGEVKIYYEGATFHQVNMKTLADRARQAVGRMLAHAPTTTVRVVPKAALLPVGTFDRGRILLADPRAASAVADWLGTDAIDPAELGAGIPTPTMQQALAIQEAVAGYEENGDIVLESWQLIDGSEFHDGDPAPADRVYVEFRYLDPHRLDEFEHRPGREVQVFGTDGTVLESQDLG